MHVLPDGTIFLPYYDIATDTERYSVYPNGATAPTRTIIDTLAQDSPGGGFAFQAFAMRVADDGTLYVIEWLYESGDVNNGLYVYPPSGPQSHIISGASAPTGLDLDAAGNVYVVNSNESSITGGPPFNASTLDELTVFSPHATAPLRQVSAGFHNAQGLTVTPDGTAYIVEAADGDVFGNAIAALAPGSTSAQLLITASNNGNVLVSTGIAGQSLTRRAGFGSRRPSSRQLWRRCR